MLFSCDSAKLDLNNVQDLGNRIIVHGTLAIADKWLEYRNQDGSTRWEFVPADTLFNQDSLLSLQGAPLCVEHPGDITPDNYREMVGKGDLVGSISTQIIADRDSKQLDIIATIYDKPTIEEVLKGGIQELSPAYWKTLDSIEGMAENCFKQTSRTYRNGEVSLVRMARGGKNARLHMSYDSVAKDVPKTFYLGGGRVATFNCDGVDVKVSDQESAILTKWADKNSSELKTAQDSLAKANEEKAALAAEKAALTKDKADLAKQVKELEEKATDGTAIKERRKLERLAFPYFKKHNSEFSEDSIDDLTNRQIQEAVIAIALPDLPEVKSKSLDKADDIIIGAYTRTIPALDSVATEKEPEPKQKAEDSSDPLRLIGSGKAGKITSQDSDQEQQKAIDSFLKEEEEAYKALLK